LVRYAGHEPVERMLKVVLRHRRGLLDSYLDVSVPRYATVLGTVPQAPLEGLAVTRKAKLLDQTDNPLVDGLLDIEAVARTLCVSKKYVYANHKVDGPPAIRIGSLLRWRSSDLQRWIEAKAVASGTAPLTFRGAKA
jgi:predicted DNA-binding transcriptional regulator AlpA